MGIDLHVFEAAQGRDNDAAHLQQMKGFYFPYVMYNDVPILCDVSTGILRPILPTTLPPPGLHDGTWAVTRRNLCHQEIDHQKVVVEKHEHRHESVVQGVHCLPGV